MITIIAGCRDFNNCLVVIEAIKSSGIPISKVISGGATGVDFLGEAWAIQHHIPKQIFPANWKEYGKSAGPRRNQEMVDIADALIACWDYTSRGTLDIINKAKTKGLQVYIFDIRPYK
jgi:hypothetical protein